MKCPLNTHSPLEERLVARPRAGQDMLSPCRSWLEDVQVLNRGGSYAGRGYFSRATGESLQGGGARPPGGSSSVQRVLKGIRRKFSLGSLNWTSPVLHTQGVPELLVLAVRVRSPEDTLRVLLVTVALSAARVQTQTSTSALRIQTRVDVDGENPVGLVAPVGSACFARVRRCALQRVGGPAIWECAFLCPVPLLVGACWTRTGKQLDDHGIRDSVRGVPIGEGEFAC